MSLVVQKYGGTSVGSIKRIKRVASRIVNCVKGGDKLVVVVSAMGKTTDNLLSLCHQISTNPSPRELDMLLSAGERISMALLSLAIEELGERAVSFTGSQVGILTDEAHTRAKILGIKGDRLKRALSEGKIPIVAGFQGVSREHEVTTLGRGGSDTTAVALASALGADWCEIYTDVEGLFTENPREFSGVKKIKELSYDEMFELASSGAKVLHERAAALAARYGVKLIIKSSFSRHLSGNRKEGTIISNSIGLEAPFVRGITHSHGLSLFTILDVAPKVNYFSEVLTDLSKYGIRIRFFLHGITQNGSLHLSFIVEDNDFVKANKQFSRLVRKIGAKGLTLKRGLGSISLVGPGIGDEPSILAGGFEVLGKKGISVETLSVSEIRITCVVDDKLVHDAVKLLLKEFNLNK